MVCAGATARDGLVGAGAAGAGAEAGLSLRNIYCFKMSKHDQIDKIDIQPIVGKE